MLFGLRSFPILFWVSLSLFTLAPQTQANERLRPRNAEELNLLTPLSGARKDEFVRLKNARLAFADYSALKRDFPELRPLSHDVIAQWLLQQFAYISVEQLRLSGIRTTEIEVIETETRTGYRPPSYGRGAVFEAISPLGEVLGMVDLKGIGHSSVDRGNHSLVSVQVHKFNKAKGDPALIDTLRKEDHNDGVMSGGEAIAELTRQQAIQKRFDIDWHTHGIDRQTVEMYFIIDPGFDLLKDQGQQIPAAILGRQAHWGRQHGLDVPSTIYTDEFGSKQHSYFEAAVDYGGVRVTDPTLAANFGTIEGGNPKNPQHSKPWAWGHETFHSYRSGHDPWAIDVHLDSMLAPIDSEWRHAIRLEGPKSSKTKIRLEALNALENNLPAEEVERHLKLLTDIRDTQGAHWVGLAIHRMSLSNAITSIPSLYATWGKAIEKKLQNGKHVPTADQISSLLKHLKHEKPDVQTLALDCVRNWIFQLETAPRDLVDILKHPDPKTREKAAYLLRHSKRLDPETQLRLNELVIGNDPSLRKHATFVLSGQVSSDSTLLFWAQSLGHPNREVRQHLFALFDSTPQMPAPVFEALMESLSKTPSEARGEILRILEGAPAELKTQLSQESRSKLQRLTGSLHPGTARFAKVILAGKISQPAEPKPQSLCSRLLERLFE